MRLFLLTFCLLSGIVPLIAQRNFKLQSPDGRLSVSIQVGKRITYSIVHEKDLVLSPSPVAMELEDGSAFGVGSTLIRQQTTTINQEIRTTLYKKSSITDHYKELVLEFREGFNLVFRAYNEGAAYRFISTRQTGFHVKNEPVVFNFAKDYDAWVPYVKSKAKDITGQYFNSFENTYTYTPLSKMSPNKLAFTPLLVALDNGKKVCIAEADLESYPGMYLVNSDGATSLKSNFASYPLATEQGGHNQLQQLVTSRAPYIARCKGATNFPWRILIVSASDRELPDNDMVYKLAAPQRINDLSWIKPGKVAWEWWNHWGISRVDFEAGVNTATYMAYIDFAAKNGIEYVILDEGWAVNLKADLMQVVPEIDLEKLIAYGKQKNVGIILWAGYYAFDRDMEQVCKHYAEMGVKGFKIDFMDRDDQPMVDFHYRAAQTAARYQLLVDFHGTYKPTGLNRTYPNVINYEAVNGLEQMKWTGPEMDMVTYDVTMPFIRMVAGPVDYTQGAMRNATKRTHRGINDEPMSQGTRCRQLAEYVVFESPLNMLCDSPDNYEKEAECTAFIAHIPTVWDRTISLDGAVGQYIAIARQKGDYWYVGGLTNWEARTMEIDLSFLGAGDFTAEVFRDGANASRIASDYKKEITDIPSNRKMALKMAPGGGFALKIYRKIK
ncbi:glycoside hydrolase family 97 protein [Niabella yanshanensis]|uniref:Glycoside hydrolase family 97 protein n=1 Tax=Niabella yanshanensis TaxID=577386 RepID=A0ABZ0W7D9_9BACT|nr:glycoside hydrolase family 97 protein [Niabella yanshanensis]WQD38518.1 glycoside hydrolase family 97 protein [Niabella yanshanensis]